MFWAIVTDEAGRLIWFHIPIALSLLINVIGCILIVRKIFTHDREMARMKKRMKFNIRDPKKRNPKMNRYSWFIYRAWQKSGP